MPERLPKESRLSPKYVVPYCGSSKAICNMYKLFPLNRDLEWDAKLPWNSNFPDRARKRDNPSGDRAFAQLRLQGSNPFMLARDPDGDETDFVLDFSGAFHGLMDPVVARFSCDNALNVRASRRGD